MLHHPHPLALAADRFLNPELGTVVLFRFPISEDDNSPNPPKRRPCLVFDTPQRGPDRFVDLAYGTSSSGSANRGYEVIVRHPQSQAMAGLVKPTRFVCARRITVHINNPGFDCPVEEASPVIGCLDVALMERMHALRAHIQAEANIAAHYRGEQQAEQARWAHKVRGFR